jgi:hypothetical protein
MGVEMTDVGVLIERRGGGGARPFPGGSVKLTRCGVSRLGEVEMRPEMVIEEVVATEGCGGTAGTLSIGRDLRNWEIGRIVALRVECLWGAGQTRRKVVACVPGPREGLRESGHGR